MNENNNIPDGIKLPVYQIFTKELTLAGLPRSLGIAVIACIGFSALSIRSMILTIFFLILYFVLLILVKLSPKFDPKIVEVLFRFSFKKYINY